MLSEAQKLDCHMLLGVPAGDFYSNPHQYASQELEKVLSILTGAQETKVIEILAKFEKVKFSTGTLSGEYSDDPANNRFQLKSLLSDVTSFHPDVYGIGRRLGLGRS